MAISTPLSIANMANTLEYRVAIPAVGHHIFQIEQGVDEVCVLRLSLLI